jgi:hypothetical protein
MRLIRVSPPGKIPAPICQLYLLTAAYIAEMADHAVRHGVKFDKPALGVTP